MCQQRIYREIAFSNTSFNEKVDIFNRIILYILNNFLPLEINVYEEKDPPRSNNGIEILIQEKKWYV